MVRVVRRKVGRRLRGGASTRRQRRFDFSLSTIRNIINNSSRNIANRVSPRDAQMIVNTVDRLARTSRQLADSGPRGRARGAASARRAASRGRRNAPRHPPASAPLPPPVPAARAAAAPDSPPVVYVPAAAAAAAPAPNYYPPSLPGSPWSSDDDSTPPSSPSPPPDLNAVGVRRTLPSFFRVLPSPHPPAGRPNYHARGRRKRKHNNYYILPKEILEFLYNNPNFQFVSETDPAEHVDLRRIRESIQYYGIRHFQEPHLNVTNRDRRNNPVKFAINELRKVLFTDKNNGTFFPTVEFANPDDDDSLDKLHIPSRDVRDLPVYIMLFVLWQVSQAAFNHPDASFTVQYAIGPDSVTHDPTRYVIKYPTNGHPVVINAGLGVTMNALRAIYMSIMRQFAAILPPSDPASRDFRLTWNGSEGSGTRIMLREYSEDFNVELSLIFTPVRSQRRGARWTPAVEKMLRETVGDAIVSVRNKNDDKCLLYCIVLGLLIKCRKDVDGRRTFGNTPAFIDDFEVYTKGCYLYTDDSEMSKLTRRLAHCLIVPEYSSGVVADPLIAFVEELDKKVGTTTSVTEFTDEFKTIERTLIPDKKLAGIDVYGIDFNINKHVYPLYISENRDNVMELLCVSPPNSDCSHYCLILNSEKLFRATGGKQFYSCSKCGQTYYHRRLLKDHRCSALPPRPGDAGGEYHYSKKGVYPEIDVDVGYCTKCRLAFTNEFEYGYHKEHCFMSGQSGYRHVQLVDYDVTQHPTLDGVPLDEKAEDDHVKNRRVMYADFESSIDPETGDHNFMSYGIYDWDDDIYECGYSLQGFFDFILSHAYDGPQEHVYVYFHNAMGYDANFVLRHVMKTEKYQNWGIQVIMKSSNRLQKLVFYSKNEGGDEHRLIHICDTFLFLTLSLERIVDSIRKDSLEINMNNFPRYFEVFANRYPWVEEKHINHILRKNIFPYRFFSSSKKLDVKIEEFRRVFEPKEENLQFFGERVTVADLSEGYADTQAVIDVFRCRTARDYHDLYLCCDVMQLADVFDRSMRILWDSHHIHLTRYLGMPSASWAAFLRHDPSMKIPLYENTFYAEFFKAMIRGGITSAPLRHAVADEFHSIIYLDVNGLYPYVMQAYKYPCGLFKFKPGGWTGEQCTVRLNEVFDRLERENKGMCFCVDLHIPEAVKRATDMYPFAPEHRQIYAEYYTDFEKKELTPFLRRWAEANEKEKMGAFNGLVCTLYDKKKYHVHWRILKFYMEHGVEVKKVWFGVEFDEGDYLAGYIRKNIEIRNTRKDELGKTLYKLLGNSIYGKTFESPFKRNTFEIVRDPTKLKGLLETGHISSMTPIDDLGWVVKMDGEDIVLDKPTYIGACVTEYAKLHMYSLLYDKLIPMFPGTPEEPGLQLVYTDTDSFIVRVRHPGGVAMQPADLFRYIKNKDPSLIGGIGGQVKSETGEDDTIQEIIALRSKVYAYRTIHGHHDRRAKGTTHEAQELQLNFEAYKETLEHLTAFNTNNTQFVRARFKVKTMKVGRRSLSVNDGKRYVEEDGIHTHAFGYPDIPAGVGDEDGDDDDDDDVEMN